LHDPALMIGFCSLVVRSAERERGSVLAKAGRSDLLDEIEEAHKQDLMCYKTQKSGQGAQPTEGMILEFSHVLLHPLRELKEVLAGKNLDEVCR
jgi:hypothetical protein